MEYFKHDINASMDDKICDLLADGGYELLGYYWRFVEYLYSRGGKMRKDRINGVAWSLHMDADKLSQMICTYELFFEDDEFIYSERINKEIGEFQAVGKRMAEIGRSGGQASAQAKAKRAVEENQAHGKRTLENDASGGQASAQQKKIKENKINKINKNKIKESESNTRAHAYGHYENVFLTDEQINFLKNKFPSDWMSKIERLSKYMADSGKDYASHFDTILEWAEQDDKTGADSDIGDVVNMTIIREMRGEYNST